MLYLPFNDPTRPTNREGVRREEGVVGFLITQFDPLSAGACQPVHEPTRY